MTQPLAKNAAPAVLQPKTRVDVFIGEVLPPERLDLITETLPAHVKPERFQRNLTIAITQHPKLLNCEPAAVFNEVSKAAALGLYLDPQLGEAYLITGWSNGRDVPQLRLGYRGLIKLARQSGQITQAYAHEVCREDPCDITLGTDKTITHKPDFSKPRGEVLFYYAVAKFADGSDDFEPMTLPDIYTIRDRSDAWRAFKAGKIKSTPWATDEGEMCKKTVLRRLLKRLPQSPELADALRLDDADFTESDAVPRLSVVQRLKARRAADQREGFNPAQITSALDGETAEFSDGAPDEPAPEAETQVDDDFPGDRPATAYFDVLAWADKLERELPDYASVDIMRLDWNEHKAELQARDPLRCKALNLAIATRAQEIGAGQ